MAVIEKLRNVDNKRRDVPSFDPSTHSISFSANIGRIVKSNPLGVLKGMEVMFLRKAASSYCYNDPMVLQIENTNLCNLGCSFCPRQKDKRYIPKEMSYEDFVSVLDPWIHHLFSIHIFGRGEPLLGKSIYEMIDFAASKGVPHVSITSNGILLNRERAEELAKSGLSELRISVDGSNPESFAKIRGADLEKLEENVRYFLSISDIPLSINFALCAENWDDILNMPRLVRRLGARCLRVFPINVYDDEIEEGMALSKSQCMRYPDIGREQQTACEEEEIGLIMDRAVLKECLIPFVMAFINVDFQLTPCCKLEDISMGNVKEKGFREVWNGEGMRAWRKGLLNGYYPSPCARIRCLRNWLPQS